MKWLQVIGMAAAAAASAGCAVTPPAPEADAPETAFAAALIRQKCSACHTLEVAMSGKRTEAQWGEVLEAMVGHGMVATDEELRIMQGHLARPR